MRAHRILLVSALATSMLASPGAAQTASKKPLDHSVYDIWNRITNQALSNDGRWALFAYVSEANDPTLNVRDLEGNGPPRAIERGEGARFTADSRFVIFTIKPAKAVVEKAKKDKVKPDKMPKDSLGILDLSSGMITRVEKVQSYKVPEEAGGWVAYLLEKPPAQTDSAHKPPAESQARPAAGANGKKKEKKKTEGAPLILRNLASGEETRVDDVVDYAFSKNGRLLAYTAANKDGTADGAFARQLAGGKTVALLTGKGDYKRLALDEAGQQVAFLSDRDDFEADQPAATLYYWDGKADAARALVGDDAPAIPDGWWISDNSALSFSKNGRRLFFGTSPRPAPEVEDTVPADKRVSVDIWNWQDPYLQPMQLKQVDQERRRTYRAVVQPKDGKVIQLATEDMPDLRLGSDGDADVAIGVSNLPYRQEVSWDGGYADYYLVDVNTGARKKLLEHLPGGVSLSPTAHYAVWFDDETEQWMAMDTRTAQVRTISEGIPTPLYDVQDDHPAPPPSLGAAGWTTDDAAFLVYDANDIWAVDPTGKNRPRNITEGVGRRDHIRFRYVDLDRSGGGPFFGFRGAGSSDAIDPSKDILLSAFNEDTKADGFYRDRVRGTTPPAKLIMDAVSFGFPAKAKDDDVLMLTRGSFEQFPDLYVTGPDFSGLRRISDANPQQAEYLWGTSELVSWRSDDGTPLQGILYKPEGFDPSRKYPMMVYFYERLSDNLNRYVTPAAGSSSINISYYVSNGYLVFTPDIPYRVGYPGESALKAVVPGVNSLVATGFVDPAHIGVQGHSWGGYQIAYLVTRTNIFTAAEAGAPVSDMVSAYGGIRWGTGMSRMFQYEKTQSRIGGSLWDAPLHYIENSPIFWADKVETPLLMMHNDADGAVPWYQGIEYFTALRRLNKPAWLVVYNGEDHGLRKLQNRKDWTIRLQQYFDHYLKGAPAPVWLADGVPAIMKGKTLGLELVTEEKPVTAPEATGGKNH